MGQKHSSSEITDSEMAMTNRTDLSSHFNTNVMSKTYQTDECFNCGAALEDNNLFINSSGTSKKSSTENSVRCRQCRV
uniref:Uncharacterized protein n=1 Tax=Daphnia galeata TaxID=27404 RepID=A0A8J2RTV7_9CRUS|nr:unnamed protein product [Daphnia galeata]